MSALDGLEVVQLGSGIALDYCGKLLADQGADVVKVEPVDGDPMRGWRASDPDHPTTDTGALFHYLNTSKRSATLDPDEANQLCAGWADLVVRTDDHALPECDGVVVSIGPYGRTGPLVGTPWTELTLQGWCGAISARGAPDRPPVQLGGRVGEWLGGAAAALAGAAGILHRESTGTAPRFDVSLLEVMAVCTVTYPTLYRDFTGSAAALSGRRSEYPSVERCKDGWIGLCIFSAQQWADFAGMIGRPELAEDVRLSSMAARGANRDLAVSVIEPWLLEHTRDEIFELGGLFRVPVSYVGNGASLPDMDHLRQRGVFVTSPGTPFVQPRSPFTMSATPVRPLRPVPGAGADTDALRAELHGRSGTAAARPAPAAAAQGAARPLAGVTVLDLTAYWAGPAGTHLLCALGADVLKVETVRRPDGIRFGTVASPESADWLERSPIFQGTNPGKRSVAIDLSTQAGRELALRLVAVSDGVWENFTPRVMDNLGLGYEELRTARSDVIMVRIPGFGLDGPWRDHAGFAQTMEQVSGMGWMTGYRDRNPLVRTTCDPAAGMHAAFAFLAALRHRRRTGQGQLIEMPMAEMAVNITAEQVLEHSAYGALLERDANRGPVGAPQGVYPTAGDEQWVALAIRSDEEWAALVDVMGRPDWAGAPELARAAGRRGAHDRVDALLSEWTALQDRDGLVARLLQAGIPGAPVWPQTDIDQVPQLIEGGLFQPVAHPTIGTVTLPGTGIHSDRVSTDYPGAAPLLGQHTGEVLSEKLGCTDAEIDRLVEAGAVFVRP